LALVDVLRVLNQVKDEGIIQDYAIIGGYAVIYYAVPYSTFDLHIAVLLKSESDFHNLYEYFRQRGSKMSGVYIYVADMPVQFLPGYISPLYTEAVERARPIAVEGVPAKVATIEYLIVLALEAFRAKDKYRISQLIDRADKTLVAHLMDKFDDKQGRLHARYKEVLAGSR
jgi:predicted nucleotidyltransferase